MPKPPSETELPHITAAEWAVAETVWDAGRPVSSSEIVDRLSGQAARHPKTVRTLLHRLVQKQVVVTERRGRTDYFFPRLSRAEYVELETRSLVARLFAGRRAGLLLHLLREGKELSPADLAVLRERLAELTGEDATKKSR